MHDVFIMRFEKIAFQRDKASRAMIIHAMTSWANFTMRIVGCSTPLPMAFMKQRAALVRTLLEDKPIILMEFGHPSHEDDDGVVISNAFWNKPVGHRPTTPSTELFTQNSEDIITMADIL